VVVHRSRNLVRQPLPPWELPRTPIAETVLDLAASAKTIDDAYGWLSQAIGSGLATRAMLRNALAARKRIRWRARIAEALTETAEGIMSPLERRYVRDVERAHGLPTASRQFRVVDQVTGQVRYLDNYYEAFRLCVELDGLASHPPEQKWRDADRDSDNLFRKDIQTVRFGLLHVTTRRCQVAANLATLFIRRGWDAVGLRACGPGCAVHRVLDAVQSGNPHPQGAHRPESEDCASLGSPSRPERRAKTRVPVAGAYSPWIRRSRWLRNSGSSSGPLGAVHTGRSAWTERVAG